MKKFAASAFVLAFVSLTAHAQSLPVDPDARLSLGVNVGYTASAYKADNTVGFAPQGFYDNNRWYIEGGELGFILIKTINIMRASALAMMGVASIQMMLMMRLKAWMSVKPPSLHMPATCTSRQLVDSRPKLLPMLAVVMMVRL